MKNRVADAAAASPQYDIPQEGAHGVSASVIDWPENERAPLAVEIAGVRFTRAAGQRSEGDNPTTELTRVPLLLRLEHGVHFTEDDLEKLQPRIGASVTVYAPFGKDIEADPKTIWLPAQAWEGIGTIVRQTPHWHRHGVVTLLQILHSSISGNDPLCALLNEVIAEVEHDPYTNVAAADRGAFDYHW